MKSESDVAQSCPILCDPMHCSLLCSPTHGISQARVLEWGRHSQNVIQFYYYYLIVPGDSTGKEPACQCRRCKRWVFNPWVGKIPCGEGHSNPLQCSCQENRIDRGAWRATVHRVTKRQTQLKRLSTSKLTCFCNLCLPPLTPESVGREGKFALY